jgi:hypothetical protein
MALSSIPNSLLFEHQLYRTVPYSNGDYLFSFEDDLAIRTSNIMGEAPFSIDQFPEAASEEVTSREIGDTGYKKSAGELPNWLSSTGLGLKI